MDLKHTVEVSVKINDQNLIVEVVIIGNNREQAIKEALKKVKSDIVVELASLKIENVD